ncbi:MAG: hypothetical protein JO161_09680, partial [Planctomycetaceae bacterium]|nr:hypothetical protein [Planctomycetaceae bacterium]
MSPSHKVPRQKRGQNLALEPLEDRQLLSAQEGATFAIMPGTITSPGQISTVKFTLNPTEFKPGRGGKILLGIDVAADSSSNLKPQIVGVQKANGRSAGELIRSMYTATIIKSKKLSNPLSSAILIRLAGPKASQAPAVYTLDVRGLNGTTRNYLVGYYLPGDVAGTGTVTQTDLSTIASDIGATPTSSN